MKMRVFVVVFVSRAVILAQSVFGRITRIYHLMYQALFLKSFERTIQGNAISIRQAPLQLRVSNSLVLTF